MDDYTRSNPLTNDDISELAYDGDNKEAYLLFLNLRKKISPVFYLLTQYFSKQGISIIPITVEELAHFASAETQHLIILSSNLEEYIAFQALRNRLLKFFMLKKCFRLYHINSYANLVGFSRSEKLGHYFHIRLPCASADLCEFLMMKMIRAEDPVSQAWPGGKKARLPFSK